MANANDTVKQSSMDALERLAALSTQGALGVLAAVTTPIVTPGINATQTSAGSDPQILSQSSTPPTPHELAYILGFPRPPANGEKFSLQQHQQAVKAIGDLQVQYDQSNLEGKQQIDPVIHVMRGLFSMLKSPVADTHGVVVSL